MPELQTEPSAEMLMPVEEISPEGPSAAPTSTMQSTAEPDSVYARLDDLANANGTQEPSPETMASILGRAEYALPVNASQKAGLITDLQQRYGNVYVQKVMTLVQMAIISEPAPPTETEAAVTETPEVAPAAQEEAEETRQIPPAAPDIGVTGEVEAPPSQAIMPSPTPEPTEISAAVTEAPPTIPEVAPVVPQESIFPAVTVESIPGETEVPALEEEEVPEGAPEAAAPSTEGVGQAPSEAAAEGTEESAEMAKGEAPEAVGKETEGEEAPKAAAGAATAKGKRAPASPEEDPAFQAVVERSKGTATQQQAHPSAEGEAASAQAAASGPSNEVTSVAAAGQVQEMDAQEPQEFNREAFKAALLQKIAETAPRTLEEADEFKDSGKLDSVKGDMTTQVTEGKEQTQGNIAEKVEETPDTSGIEPKPVTPLEPTDAGPPPADIGATEAAPKAKSASEVSLQEGSQSLDQQMADSEITEEQLENSNEPSFQGAVESKRTAQTDAQEAPQAYRQQEQDILAGAEAEAQSDAQVGLESMSAERGAALEQVTTAQTETQSLDEQRRTEVANHIEEIYQRSKENVEARLSQLDEEVNQAFDQGAAGAQQAFEDYVEQRMDAYKDRRYSGLIGAGRWVKDKLLGLPDEVNVFYEEGRNLYIKMMDGVLDNIAIIVETGLNEAKAEIANGRQEIQEYVAGLPLDLQQVGQEAAENIQSRFDELEQSVNDKQGELIDSLARRYNENLQQIDARIEEMQAANRGLVDAAFDAIAGVIRTIIELKNMLLNVLSRAASAIGLIIKDPIGFLGNLVSGVMQGLQNFISNLGTHLRQGLMDWLFGALGEAGIQMPESFDLKGILSLVLQVLGLTYANIRARAVAIVGEPIVNALEQAAEIFRIMITEGPAGLWEWIKDKVGDLKSMVLDGIKDFVMQKIIIAGVTWILSLLNPASAFIKACKAIYDIIMFFVTRGSQIMALVNAVIDSVTAIAQGSLSVAANAVENALARAIPVVIGFLASLLGVGGISEKIRSIIAKIQAPINKAIDWVINKAVQLVQAAGGLFGVGRRDDEDLGDAKNAARDAVRSRLGDGATVPEAERTLPQIQRELQPMGLKSLTLGPEDTDGERPILAEASLQERISVLAKKEVIVAVSATIQMKTEDTAPVLEGINRPLLGGSTSPPLVTEEYPEPRRTALGGTGRAALLPPVPQPPRTPARRGSQPSAGLIIEPESESRSLEVVAWNTSQPERGHNVSHAERQFVEWFESRPPSWRQRVESVNIVVDGREICEQCLADLTRLRESMTWIRFSWTGDESVVEELEVQSP